MKKKHSLSTVLILLLMLAGLGVMFFPKISDFYACWMAKQEISEYNQVIESEGVDYSPYWEAAEAYNRALAAQDHFSVLPTEALREEVFGYLNPLGNGMMGYVDIPKINVHIPIYQGTEEKALQAGAGFWLGTSLPTGGSSTHCVLTAHNGLVKAKMFTDLDQLEVGDTFSLAVLDRVLTYQVDQILVTEPDDMEPLHIIDGEDHVTLYTCTPYGVNTHRLLVRGQRIEAPQEPLAAIGGSGTLLLAAGAVLAAVLLSLAAILLLIGSRRRKEDAAAHSKK